MKHPRAIWALRIGPLTSSLSDSSPQTSSVALNSTESLDSTQDQHAKKQQTLLVLLAQLLRSVFTSPERLHWSSAKITLCHISLAQSDSMFNWAYKKAIGFVLIHSRHTSPTYPCSTSQFLPAYLFLFYFSLFWLVSLKFLNHTRQHLSRTQNNIPYSRTFR